MDDFAEMPKRFSGEASDRFRRHTCLARHDGPDQVQLATLPSGSFALVSAPGRIRTCDLRIRSPLLYPN
jgi:hypothetical protein